MKLITLKRKIWRLHRLCYFSGPWIAIFAVLMIMLLYSIYRFFFDSTDSSYNQFSSFDSDRRSNASLFNWTAIVQSMTKLTESAYGASGLNSKHFADVGHKCGRRKGHLSDATLLEGSFLIEPRVCRGRVFLLVATIMSADNFKERFKIRDTWASQRFYSNQPVEFVFVIPRSFDSAVQTRVEDEADKHQDILQLDVDFRAKLSGRQCLSGLFLWILKNCPQASYLFKTDEILYLDVFHSVQFLQTSQPSHFLCNTQRLKPNRRRKSGDYIPYYVYRRKYFPKSCMNYGYFLNTMIIKDLYMCDLLLMDSRMHLADIHFTGIVAEKLSLTREKFWSTHSWTFFKPSLSGRAAADFLFMRSPQPDIALMYWKKLWRETLKLYC